MSLFSELKRRNVFRVAAAYVVISWLLIQVFGLAADSFAAPEWVMKMIIVVLLIGFIPTLLFSWAFELTPEGLKKESDIESDRSINNHTSKKLNIITLIAIILVVLLIIVDRFYSKSNSSPETISITEQGGNSIAVLPFIDLSQKGDEEYFADGISEEILNVLVRIPKLKVAGRTSSFSFKGRNEDLRKIGEALGVNHILEGSVRRSGSKLRITAQLIRGKDGFHLWSETYDREATDIFKIQDEIARAVAKQLALSLGLSSKNLVKDRTDDIVAYEHYLHAKQLYLARGTDNLEQAALLLQEVVARDPNFTPAWTAIAQVYAVYGYYQSIEIRSKKNKSWHAIGLAAVKRSIELDPMNATAITQMGVYFSYNNQFIEAFESYDKALGISSENNDVLDGISQAMLDVGYFDEAVSLSEKAVKNAPLVVIYRNTLGRHYKTLGDYDKAIVQFNEMIKLDPQWGPSYNNLIDIYINQYKIEDAVAIQSLRVKNTNRGQEFLNFLKLLRDNKNNKEGLYKLMKGDDAYTISILLDDMDTYLVYMQAVWSQKNRNDKDIFDGALVSTSNGAEVLKSPIWKAQIRKEGILKLWQSRGFPAQCKSLPDSDIEDDFECNFNKQESE
ncbi:MAG: adenylate cyclase [Enterobacterales bacterium]|jgi:adenylate cyclase